MTLFDVLAVAAIFCLMEARNCAKREKIWKAIDDLDNRKLDRE
jgi:hypothetical protein